MIRNSHPNSLIFSAKSQRCYHVNQKFQKCMFHARAPIFCFIKFEPDRVCWSLTWPSPQMTLSNLVFLVCFRLPSYAETLYFQKFEPYFVEGTQLRKRSDSVSELKKLKQSCSCLSMQSLQIAKFESFLIGRIFSANHDPACSLLDPFQHNTLISRNSWLPHRASIFCC